MDIHRHLLPPDSIKSVPVKRLQSFSNPAI